MSNHKWNNILGMDFPSAHFAPLACNDGRIDWECCGCCSAVHEQRNRWFSHFWGIFCWCARVRVCLFSIQPSSPPRLWNDKLAKHSHRMFFHVTPEKHSTIQLWKTSFTGNRMSMRSLAVNKFLYFDWSPFGESRYPRCRECERTKRLSERDWEWEIIHGTM